MRIKKFISSLIIFFIFHAYINADTKSPVDPSEPKTSTGEKNKKAQSNTATEKFKVQVSVLFANKNKLNGTAEFSGDRISLLFYQGGRLRNVSEKISNVQSVDFIKWEKQRSGSRYVYYHSNAIVTTRDGTVYNCINIGMLNKIRLSGKTGNIDCYSYFYSWKNENKKSRNSVIYSETNPHPDTLVKITFSQESEKSGLEDIVPLFFK
jgi:hypothetical protein